MNKKDIALTLNCLMIRCLLYDSQNSFSEERDNILNSINDLATLLDIPVVSLPQYSEWPIFTYEESFFYKEANKRLDKNK